MSDYIPEEILIEILIKLPVKSLIRGTSVCKQWRCLIRSPAFISTHLSNIEDQTFLRRYDTKERREYFTVIPKRGPFVINSASELEIPFNCQFWFFGIVGSSDGLVCLFQDFNKRIIIWNPAIRNHVVLPPSLIDPEQTHPFALGFGVGNNIYKVVRLVYRSELLQAEIFCLGGTESEGWRKLTGFDVRVRFLINYIMNLCYPIFFKGFVHWIPHEPMRDCNSILRFHVGDEIFDETMLPDELEKNDIMFLSLAIMGESLGFIKYDKKIGNHRCDVWMMKDYGVKESWTKLYTIDAEGLDRVIGFWGSGDAVVVVLGHELATYNPETKGIRHVGVYGYSRSFYVDDYKESLVLLGGGYSKDPTGEPSDFIACNTHVH